MIFFRFCFTVITKNIVRFGFCLVQTVWWCGPALIAQEVASRAAAVEAGKQTQSEDYVLQPSDVIKIVVFQELDLERQVRISQEGTVALPLIDIVDLKEKTVRQAEEMIRKAYDRDYLVDPQITISVIEYSKRTVSVSGSVAKQGAISFPPEKKMTLVEAISEAGPNRLAYLKEVRLTRTLPDGTKKTFIIDVDKLMRGISGDDWPLQKDDVIWVPERLL